MLEPLAVDPNRSVAPAANSIASAKLVFPAPAGPTSAITRVPLDGCPTMRLSLRPVHGRASRSLRGARAPVWQPPPSACFLRLARWVVTHPCDWSWNALTRTEVLVGHGRSEGTSGVVAIANAAERVEGCGAPHLEARFGGQCQHRCRGRSVLRLPRARAFARRRGSHLRHCGRPPDGR